MKDIHAALSEPFPVEMERSVNKGGRNLTYIPISEVIARLNKVIGINNWSSEIISCQRDAIDPHWAIAHVRLTATIDGQTVVKDGIGGQQIKMTKAGAILDLGDEFKGAMSDALKKAAQQLGVALYLARSEEALEMEEVLSVPPAPPVDPQIEQLFNKIKEFKTNMDEDASNALDKFWSEYSEGRPKPTKATATVKDLEAIIGECVRLTMGGEFVDPE
jgi:recombination DNA repair RAD52 pathway protein